MRKRGTLCGVLGLVVFASSAASGGDFSVNTAADALDWNPGDGICESTDPGSQICALRSAIMEANALGGSHTINLPAATFPIQLAGADEDDNLTGDFDILADVTIRSDGPGDAVIDAQGLDRVFEVFRSAELRLEDIEVRGGVIDGDGGGIMALGELFVTGGAIRDNVATRGGGIWTSLLAAELTNTTVSGNEALLSGGGVVANGNLTLLDSNVVGNSAIRQGGITHGLNGTLTLDGVLVADNHATNGNTGGIDAGSVTHLRNTTISGNVTNTSFGGIRVAGSLLTLHNVTLTNNLADSDVGMGGCGGGIGTDPGTPTGSIEIRIANSILTGNRRGSDPAGTGTTDCCLGGTPLTSEGRNLFGEANACQRVGATETDLLLDPRLEALADDGPTQTHLPRATSPAIDAADPGGCRDDEGVLLTVDQRGRVRPLDGDGDGVARCDIGAVETTLAVLGVTWDGDLFEIDTETANARLIGATGSTTLNSLARASSGALLSASRNPGSLLVIDPETGLGTPGADLDFSPRSTSVGALSFLGDDRLYAVNSETGPGAQHGLFEVDPATGTGTLISGVNFTFVAALDTAPSGALYGWQRDRGLLRIDPETGAQTDVNPAESGPAMLSIAFTGGGRLFGVDGTAAGTLYEIDVSSGVAKEVGPTPAGDVRGLAFLVPEPDGTVLRALAIAVLGMLAARRRRSESGGTSQLAAPSRFISR